MTTRFVEIRYTDSIERVPLHDADELRGILRERGSFVDYAIRRSLWYGLVPRRKLRMWYVPQPPGRRQRM